MDPVNGVVFFKINFNFKTKPKSEPFGLVGLFLEIPPKLRLPLFLTFKPAGTVNLDLVTPIRHASVNLDLNCSRFGETIPVYQHTIAHAAHLSRFLGVWRAHPQLQ